MVAQKKGHASNDLRPESSFVLRLNMDSSESDKRGLS